MSGIIPPLEQIGASTHQTQTTFDDSRPPSSLSAAALAESLNHTLMDNVLYPLQQSEHAFELLITLQKIISETVEDGLATPQKTPNSERLALNRIRSLSAITGHLANKFSDLVGEKKEEISNNLLSNPITSSPKTIKL
ncbi:MAG: hypothetical protein ABN482_09795 [Corticimicrobacter sp.]|uniref:hypothetical protein n=1 Tax=Corticimicrobacter sp. TaxID=2678536 RepID=UPI0032DB42A5